MAIGIVLALCAGTMAQDTKPATTVDTNIVYGKIGDTELKLDIARPKVGDGPFPVVVILHGGGFVGGSKDQLSKTLEVLAGRGYVAVAPTYRVAPKDPFPAAVEDCKATVRFLRANARTYKINEDRIGVVGFSAGGYMACMLGFTEKGDDLEGKGGHAEQSSKVHAVVAFFPPSDLMADNWTDVVLERNLKPFLGGTRSEKPELYKKASPVTYLRKSAPPLLLFHGTDDKIVPYEQSKQMAQKLQDLKVPVTLVTVEGGEHGFSDIRMQKCLEQMMKFLDESLKK